MRLGESSILVKGLDLPEGRVVHFGQGYGPAVGAGLQLQQLVSTWQGLDQAWILDQNGRPAPTNVETCCLN